MTIESDNKADKETVKDGNKSEAEATTDKNKQDKHKEGSCCGGCG